MFADLLTLTSRSTLVIRATPVAVQIRLPRHPQRFPAQSVMRNRADV